MTNSPLCWLPAQQCKGIDWETNEDQTLDDTEGWHLRVQQKEMKRRTETQVFSTELKISKGWVLETVAHLHGSTNLI